MAYRGFSGGGFVGNHLTVALLEQLRPAADNAGRRATVGNPATRAVPYSSDGEAWYPEALFTTDSSNNVTGLVGPDSSVIALSEVSAYVAATASAGATVHTGAGEFGGYICTVAAGNITIYDNTAASGTVLVPTTALTVGAFPIMGAGTNTRLALTTGCHVVLSGAATVQVLVQ